MEFDTTYFLDVSAGDPLIMQELIDIFDEQIPEFVRDMKDALQVGDYKKFASVAHKAKSSVSVFGMKEWENHLKYIQTEILENRIPNNLFEIITKFEKDAYETLYYFKEYVKGLKDK